MIRYVKKEDTKAGMIYDHTKMRYVKDSEIADILNEKENTIAELAWPESCEHEFVEVSNEKVSGVKMCIHCYRVEAL